MKNCLIFFTMFFVVLPVFAGEVRPQNDDVKRFDDNVAEMKSGRRFELSHNALIEYPDIESVGLKNVFDFDNSLIYHENAQTGEKLAVTPFSQIPTERVNYVRQIGCRIATNSGDSNPIYADKETYQFVKTHCTKGKAQ